MAATKNVPHLRSVRNSAQPSEEAPAAPQPTLETISPRHGVITLYGYGIKVHVERGHLALEDGIGRHRRIGRFARVNHNIHRLVVISSDGMVSLEALRWLADQGAAFLMLERDGKVLVATGPTAPSDARLRRAQACADQSDLAVNIAKELIDRKLTGQERVAREKVHDAATADAIAQLRTDLRDANTIDTVRVCEARAAAAYWSGWRNVKIQFPKKDQPRVPDHWLSFGTRTSPLSGFSPRLAVNPTNAVLNYLYAILESETRLAIAAMGLDPGIGFLHVDNDRRDSLACDVMEVVRPEVDEFLFDWVSSKPFNRNWFFEQRDGNCRLMSEFAVTLSETAPTWRRAVAPSVEWLARALWEQAPKMAGHRPPANRLTQSQKRKAQGGVPSLPPQRVPSPQNLCRTCGAPIMHKGIYCRLCNAEASKELFAKACDLGRKASLSGKAQAKRTATQRRNARAQHGWIAANQPGWLTQEAYVSRIQPRLAELTASAIAEAIQVSVGYADSVRKGKVHPHARHWAKLAELVGVGQME
jgi:CRISPR-associated endonuclease Cas1